LGNPTTATSDKLPEGEEIAAFVVPSHILTEATLDAHCRTRLAPDKRPRKFIFNR
jgi:acyl-CoA synthetase (AMP-forming)/AMP-acid ligase II